jgi:hypothetical protein
VTQPARAPRRSAGVRRSTSSGYPRTVGEHVRKALEGLDEAWRAQGRSLAELGTPEELAGKMLALVPEPSPWDAALGPCYSSRGVARLLGGVSRQAVAERRARRRLLGLRTADGELVYPAFQFDSRGQVVSGLAEVLACFASAPVDDWTVAGWIAMSHASLEGSSVAAWLQHGGDLGVAVALARDAARRFSA